LTPLFDPAPFPLALFFFFFFFFFLCEGSILPFRAGTAILLVLSSSLFPLSSSGAPRPNAPLRSTLMCTFLSGCWRFCKTSNQQDQLKTLEEILFVIRFFSSAGAHEPFPSSKRAPERMRKTQNSPPIPVLFPSPRGDVYPFFPCFVFFFFFVDNKPAIPNLLFRDGDLTF